MKPNEEQFAKNLLALSAPQCRRIVSALASASQTKSALANSCELSASSIHKHLAILVSANLVQFSTEDEVELCELNRAALSETQAWFCGLAQ